MSFCFPASPVESPGRATDANQSASPQQDNDGFNKIIQVDANNSYVCSSYKQIKFFKTN